jgi:lactonase
MVIMEPDGRGLEEIPAKYNGHPISPNDLVFDDNGNFYVTDLAGQVGLPAGGVYRVTADFQTVQPIIENLVTVNGICLAPIESALPTPIPYAYELWVAESALNRILRLSLAGDGITLAHPPASVVYTFSGIGGPDSNAADSEGNIYQCMAAQGRIVILNRAGVPVANVVMPGREKGENLFTTNVAFKPGTDEAYVTVGNMDGAWIYTFKGLAKGPVLFSHQ